LVTAIAGETAVETTAETTAEEILSAETVLAEIVVAIIAKFVSVGGLQVFRTTTTIALPSDTSGHSLTNKSPNWKNF
jgi:hypothetical protein